MPRPLFQTDGLQRLCGSLKQEGIEACRFATVKGKEWSIHNTWRACWGRETTEVTTEQCWPSFTEPCTFRESSWFVTCYNVEGYLDWTSALFPKTPEKDTVQIDQKFTALFNLDKIGLVNGNNFDNFTCYTGKKTSSFWCRVHQVLEKKCNSKLVGLAYDLWHVHNS